MKQENKDKKKNYLNKKIKNRKKKSYYQKEKIMNLNKILNKIRLKCNNLKDYHMTYLNCDVLCLADVFDNFKKTCVTYYKLDPANYMTSRYLAWDAMIMLTNVELELISDIKILDIMKRQKKCKELKLK